MNGDTDYGGNLIDPFRRSTIILTKELAELKREDQLEGPYEALHLPGMEGNPMRWRVSMKHPSGDGTHYAPYVRDIPEDHAREIDKTLNRLFNH